MFSDIFFFFFVHSVNYTAFLTYAFSTPPPPLSPRFLHKFSNFTPLPQAAQDETQEAKELLQEAESRAGEYEKQVDDLSDDVKRLTTQVGFLFLFLFFVFCFFGRRGVCC